MVSITNNIITDLKTLLPEVSILLDYPDTIPTFPCIIIQEQNISTDTYTYDSGGYKFIRYAVTLEIITQGATRTTKLIEIRDLIFGELVDKYRMNLTVATDIPNFADPKINRYKMTFNCLLDKNKKIYRG